MQMFSSVRCLLLTVVAVFLPTVLARNDVRLNNKISVPLHYDVQMVIDVVGRRFLVDESILIFVIKDTTELQINSNGLKGTWLEARLKDKDGVLSNSPSEAFVTYDQYSEILYLRFSEVIKGPANYTLQFTGIEGSFGMGFIGDALPMNK